MADGNIGMSHDDLRKYSLVRAINARGQPGLARCNAGA